MSLATAVEVEKGEKRHFQRLGMELPCTVEWGPHQVPGQITNMSQGGAWITRLQAAPPPEGAIVALKFKLEGQPVVVVSSVTSRVLRTILEIVEDGNIGSLAVQFEDQSREVQVELREVLDSLGSA